MPWLGDTCLAGSLEYTRLFRRVVRLNATMNVAGAERLARRLHQGEIDGNGAAYVDHLARVAALVAAEGGSRAQLMAAWLAGTARTGARPGDLARYGVPGPVIAIVDALTPRQPWEEAPSWASRVKSCRPAVLVLRACVTDLAQASLLRRGPYHAGRLRALLDLTGIEIPAALSDREAGSRPATPTAVRTVPLERLAADDPGRWDALAAVSATRDPRAAGPLLEAYLAARAGDPRWSGGRARLAGALTAMALRRLNQADPEWVTFLRRLAGHQDEFLRATAVRGLAGLPGDQERLHTALADPGPLVAGAALDSLTSAEGAADSLAAIASRLEREWTWPRRRALRLLADAGDPRTSDLVLAAVAADGMGVGRGLIGLLLQRGRDELVTSVLSRQLREGAPGADAAAYLLGELRASSHAGEIAAAMSGAPGNTPLQLACAEALGKLAEPGAGPALAAVVTGAGPALLRTAALIALAKTGHPAAAVAALAASEDFDPDVRDRAVRILARHGGREATARLLASCDGPLAPAALRGLIRIGDQRALPALRRIFLATQDRRLRHLAGRAIVRSLGNANRLYFYTGPLSAPAQVRAIAWVLGEAGDTGYSRQLRELLKHRDELTRARAAAALGKISPPDAGTPAALRAALTDISPRVRASAATALGRLPSTEVTGWLQPCRRDPHPAVRAASEAAILRQRLASCGTITTG